MIQQLPKQLEDLSTLNQKTCQELTVAEEALAKKEEQIKLMEVDAESYTALNGELTSAALKDRSSGEIAKRLVALSEELRSTKLQLVQVSWWHIVAATYHHHTLQHFRLNSTIAATDMTLRAGAS